MLYVREEEEGDTGRNIFTGWSGILHAAFELLLSKKLTEILCEILLVFIVLRV